MLGNCICLLAILSIIEGSYGLALSSNKKSKGSLFASLPFLPKPQFKPERYMKSVRAKRAYIPRTYMNRPIPQVKPVNYRQLPVRPQVPQVPQPRPQQPPQVVPVPKPVNQTTDFNFNGLSFNNVYIPMPDPSKKPYDGPTVVPILYGNYSIGQEKHLFSSSVALVIDEKIATNERCYILIDTGLPFFKNTVVGGLAAHGVKLQDISTVVLTHMDVNAVGNLNLFPHTNIMTENKIVNRQFVYIQKSAPSFDSKRSGLPFRSLCDNTDVFLTPGLSPRDLSLVVKNVSGYGTIAIVGGLIFDENDLKSDCNVKQFSLDEEQQKLWKATRTEIVCLADYILPGDIEVEKEKPRLLPSMFPNFAQLFSNFPPRPFPIPNPGPSTLPTSSPSSANNSGVFPLFPPNFGPYYALMQQNQLISQFSKNGNLLNSSTSESSMESRASSADSGNKS
ncbi:hypothetical protein FO519_006245 [Halicephalobus sp. NKZ332]|nr:hypothetical protein FO519_006245 [Halicephalobus sp. NKZ332]